MITTVVLSLLAVLFVGIIATPGLGAIGLVLAPLIGVAGGPDDPLADEHVDKGSPAIATPRQATVSRGRTFASSHRSKAESPR